MLEAVQNLGYRWRNLQIFDQCFYLVGEGDALLAIGLTVTIPFLYTVHQLHTSESPIGTGSGRSEIIPYGAGARGGPRALSTPG